MLNYLICWALLVAAVAVAIFGSMATAIFLAVLWVGCSNNAGQAAAIVQRAGQLRVRSGR